MKRSTVVWLIAVLVMFSLAVYASYLIYKENQKIDVVNVYVIDKDVIDKDGQPLEGEFVYLGNNTDQSRPSVIGITNKLGLVQFLDLPPAEYEIGVIRPFRYMKCNHIKIKLRGVTAKIELYPGSCEANITVAPKQ